MTERNHERDAAAPDAATIAVLRELLEERERRAAEREQVADQRDRLADERDRLAAERTRIADVRDWHLSLAPAPQRDGDLLKRRQAMLTRARQATERLRDRIDRVEAGLVREDADRQRKDTEVAYETARSKLERENSDGE